MQTYTLPQVIKTDKITCVLSSGISDPKLGFDPDLHLIKNQIETIPDSIWNKTIKTEVNLWEDGARPLNRASLKFDEVASGLKLFLDLPKDMPFICLCEGPGGFMECILKRRQGNNDMLYGITLRDDSDKAVPKWKFDRLDMNKIKVYSGLDGTGNLYDTRNIITFWNQVNCKSLFITADGGFDVKDYNHQEQISAKLIFCQIVSALGCQEQSEKSIFVIKMFDNFTFLSAKMLYLLGNFYDSVQITKPIKSRESNSERYVVARSFRGVSYKELNDLLGIINGWNSSINDICLDLIIPDEFLVSLENINKTICTRQIEAIKKNLQKCKGE